MQLQARLPYDKKLSKKLSQELREKVEALLENEDQIYGRIFIEKVSEDMIYCQVSLLNDSMIKLDESFISLANEYDEAIVDANKNDFLAGYHPYFFEFFMVLQRKFWKDCLEPHLGQWIHMKFVKVEKGTGQQDEIKEFKDENGLEMIALQGTVIFGASKLLRKKIKLVFEQEYQGSALSRQQDFRGEIAKYTDEYGTIVQNICKQIINNVNNIEGSVYNVGQGNCISLKFDENQVFFDVGVSISEEIDDSVFMQNGYNTLSASKPKMIILSHWHEDHVLGIGYFNEDDGEQSDKYTDEYSVYHHCAWVAPNLHILRNYNLSESMYRLCYYLLTNRIIWLLNLPDSCVTKSNVGRNTVALYQGSCQSDENGLSNNIGLVLQLNHWLSEHKCQRVLFTGDCAYEKMPNEIFVENSYSFIVASHHGSKNAVPVLATAEAHGRAIISVGVNPYHHPSIEHIKSLQEQGFQIFFTAGKSRIDFTMKLNERIYLKSIK